MPQAEAALQACRDGKQSSSLSLRPRSLSSPQNLTYHTAVSACPWSPSFPVLLPPGTGTSPAFPHLLRRAGLALGCDRSFLLLTSAHSHLTSCFLPQWHSQTFFQMICSPHAPPGAPAPVCPSSLVAALSSCRFCQPYSLFHCPQPKDQGRLQEGGRSPSVPCWSRVKLLVSSIGFLGGCRGRQRSS